MNNIYRVTFNPSLEKLPHGFSYECDSYENAKWALELLSDYTLVGHIEQNIDGEWVQCDPEEI